MSAPAWAAEYVGLPFLEKGRTRAGVDCWGIVRMVMDEHFGVTDLPDYCDSYTSTNDRDSVADAVKAGLLQGWERVETAGAATLVILRLAGRPWHCGLMLNATDMLHALEGPGTVHERIDTMLWRRRIEGMYRRAH